MDPLIKALSRIKREIEKTVAMVESPTDKLMVIELGQRRLEELRVATEGKS